MPDEPIAKPEGAETPAPDAPYPKPKRPRRKRSLKIDREAVATFVNETLTRGMLDRHERIERRKDRWLKLHGYHVGEGKDFPWTDCADFYAPIMLIAARRMAASLENSAKAMRPVVEAKAAQPRNRAKEGPVNSLLDYQFHVENRGEKKLDDYAWNFVCDEVAYWYVPWARDKETIREVRILPGYDEAVDPLVVIPAYLKILFPALTNFVMDAKDASGYAWEVDYVDEEGEPKRAHVEFYDTDDDKVEACITRDARIFDGPAPQIVDYEDIVKPTRCANLQPPNGANPHGAPWFHHLCKTDLTQIRRRMDDGTYDLLTRADWDAIVGGKSPQGGGTPDDEPKREKDEARGEQQSQPQAGSDRQLVVTYAGWDANKDGYEEQVIFWSVAMGNQQKPIVAAMRFLSEVYPGTPLLRPVAHESFFSETNRLDGYSFIEALETIQDMTEVSLNQHFDWGTITNCPVGFYRAASGLKPETMRVAPGDLIPLDDPSRDITYPQWPSRGETFNINTMTVLQQFAERLSMQSDLAFGRVPTGKSAALRTVGTTNALMSQIDVGSERALRRFFSGLCQMFNLMHRLNRRYLPKLKQIRIAGMPEAGSDPYRQIQPAEIDADMDFEFKATMLNTNKQMMGQIMQQTLAMMMSPLAIQAGIVTAEEVYNAYRDYLKSNDLDPDRYARKPMMMTPGPKLTAEDALSAIITGDADVLAAASPREPAMEHFQKLQLFQQTQEYAEILQVAPLSAQLFAQWAMRVQQQVIMEQMQQMMMAQAAGAGGGPAGPGGPGGVPSTISSDTGGAPPVQPGEALDEGGVMQ